MNPFDAFPPSNLGPPAQPWRREVEQRIVSLENGEVSQSQSLDGLNRSSAASLETLSLQVVALDEQVERVDLLFSQLSHPRQNTRVVSNFAVPTFSYDAASVTVDSPVTGSVSVMAVASGHLISTPGNPGSVQGSIRLGWGSSWSPYTSGDYQSPSGVWRLGLFSSWGWTAPVMEGDNVEIEAELAVNDPSTWPAGTGSHLSLTVFAVFQGSSD